MNIQRPMIPMGMARPRRRGVLVWWFGEEVGDEALVELVVFIVVLLLKDDVGNGNVDQSGCRDCSCHEFNCSDDKQKSEINDGY